MYQYQNEYSQITSLIEENAGNADGFVESLRRNQILHLSFSQISTVESCGFRYLLQYIEFQEPDPYPDYFQKGKVFHQIIARRYEHLRDNKTHDLNEDHTFINDYYQGSHCHHLRNAVTVMEDHIWQDYQVESIEYPFVIILAPDLPPFVGVIDLVLRREDSMYVIDHKTGRDFNDPDLLQMAIYRNHIQSLYPDSLINTYYDHYRWVENLKTIRKPAMRRTEVDLSNSDFSRTIARVRKGYTLIEKIRSRRRTERNGNCFPCPYRGNCYY